MTDFYLLDEKLTDDERGVRDRLRAFCAAEVTPIINGYWERAEFPFELVPKIAALQMAGGTIKGYGCPGMSATAAGLVSMEWARADGSMGTFYGVHSNLAMQSIDMLGSEEQKERWLPAMADLDAIGAFALTEPDHGSDAVKLESSARRDGDEWVLHGRKRWIGNATIADVVIVWARDEEGHVGGYLVEKGTPGFNATVMTGKTALRAVWQADIELDGARVPDANKLPGCRNFRDVAGVLCRTRYTVAWRALGMAHRRVRGRAGLRAAARAVRQADRELPARAGQAQPHAGRDHRDAAALPAALRARRGRPPDRGDGVAGQDESRRQGTRDRRHGARHPRRQRHPAREPRRPPARRHGGHLHLRGHRLDPVADRGPRDHGPQRDTSAAAPLRERRRGP